MPVDVTAAAATAAFLGTFLSKNVPLAVGSYTYATTEGVPIPEKPTFKPSDVSVIIPTTFKTPHELILCVRRILLSKPAAVYVVTADANVSLVKDLFELESFGYRVSVLGVEHLNKRAQILKAFEHVKTKIIVLADDDVFWPDNFLQYMLAIFEDKDVGAGGPRQRVKRDEEPSIWNMLGIAYLERRVFNNCATNAVDGSISTLSGRTAAYRSCILKDPKFQHYFMNDTWRGKPLNSDDDKCLTRYVYKEGWKIRLQFDPRSTIETTVEGDAKYLSQCMRWARAHWRGNFTVMENETYWYSKQYLWGLFYIYLGQFRTPSLLVDGLQFLLLWVATRGCSEKMATACLSALALVTLFTKNLKMIPHYRKYPQDLWFVPISIAFSYFHGFINIYAIFTMTHTQWGSQNLKKLEQACGNEEEDMVPLLHDAQTEADDMKQEMTDGADECFSENQDAQAEADDTQHEIDDSADKCFSDKQVAQQ